MKFFRKTLLVVTLCSVLFSIPVLAASNKFSFSFTDLDNHAYPTSWLKANTANKYVITLNKYNGLSKNNMSSKNIFGCKMKDMSIGPVVDVYHTFSNYVSDYGIKYQTTVNRGDTMVLAAKKDSASTSGAALNISGTIEP